MWVNGGSLSVALAVHHRARHACVTYFLNAPTFMEQITKLVLTATWTAP
jgi:hypothetical protein